MLFLLLPIMVQEPVSDPAEVQRQERAAARAAAREQQRALDAGQRVLMAVFQEDKLQNLGREELQKRMLAFDRDEDARVSFEEFQRLAAWSPVRAARGDDAAMKVEDAWNLLLRVADADADAALTHAEALTFFDARDLDRDGTLTRNERADGPRVGDKAPDFALASAGSEELSSLSKLLKEGKPIALLFGSYT